MLGVKPLNTTLYQPAESVEQLKSFLKTPLGTLFQPVELVFRDEYTYYNQPLTPEYRSGNIFLWERNPFYLEDDAEKIRPEFEYASFSFSLVYWIGRYYGFLPATGFREE